MPESHDPLRSLFQQAADAGRANATTAPLAHVVERGKRAHRRRIAALTAGACLVLACGGAATAMLLPGERPSIAPATSPSPSRPSPALTTRPPSTGAPSGRSTTEISGIPTDPVPTGGASATSTQFPVQGVGTTAP
ncbi:hypothetical protein [Streptomyces sp. NPDC002889]|uniref:hypothetical protein n=1 Tax=Streptomyces sp. NPDC002889 TaxID=3364669 RepID=UPI0036A4D749